MFPTSINNHKTLHEQRQRDLEADAHARRLVKALSQQGKVSPIRQRVGSMLIKLGKKVAEEPKQDVRLVLSARH